MLLNSLFTKFPIFSCCTPHVTAEKIIWRHVDPLLGNYRKTRKFTTSIAKQRLCKQECFYCNQRIAIMGEKIPTRSVARCYNQDQLALAVRKLVEFSHCELLLLEVGSWGRGQFGNLEDESSIQPASIIIPYTWQYISCDNLVVFFFPFSVVHVLLLLMCHLFLFDIPYWSCKSPGDTVARTEQSTTICPFTQHCPLRDLKIRGPTECDEAIPNWVGRM
jgi:hypothetical protein